MDVADLDGDENGDNQARLTTNTFEDEFPDWSPDGNKIAFSRSETGQNCDFGIYVMNEDGSGEVRLTN